MARTSQSERGRYRYGVCLNDQCEKCKAKEVQELPARKEFVCSECGKPLRECPPPKKKSFTWLYTLIAVILLGGGVGGYFAFSGHEDKTQEPDTTTVKQDSVEVKKDTTAQEPPIKVITLEQLALNTETKELKVGETDELSVTKTPAEAEAELKWTSANENVITVSDGKVTAIGKGKAAITVSATVDGKEISATCNYTVKEIPTEPTGIRVKGGIYTGKTKNGYPHGNGSIEFTSQVVFQTPAGPLTIYRGDRVTGQFQMGMLTFGNLYQEGGNTVVVKQLRVK